MAGNGCRSRSRWDHASNVAQPVSRQRRVLEDLTSRRPSRRLYWYDGKIHVLGAPHPRTEMVNALVTNAILTALGQTPWKREFRTLAPRERKNMADLVRAWAKNIAENNIAPRLGEQAKETEEAAA
jgi:hypothetical protein